MAASLIRAHNNWTTPEVAFNTTVAIRVWRLSVLAARAIPDLVSNPLQYREVRYEDLRRAPTQELRDVFEWLKLPTSDTMVNEIVAGNDLEKTRRDGRFEAISRPRKASPSAANNEPTTFFGKGAIEPDGFDLTRLQQFQCYRIAGDLLQSLGYCIDRPRAPLWAVAACSWKLRKILRLKPV